MDNPYAITAHEDACKALAFARSHDWGRDAVLRRYLAEWRLHNLKDAGTLNGEPFEGRASCPATIKAIREFGGY